MTRKHAPQGIQVVIAALALLLGVTLLTPAVPANTPTNDGGSITFGGGGKGPGSGSGTGGLPNPGPDGEADPDWWQTDTWSGNPIGEAPTSPRLPSYLVYRPYGTGFGSLVSWFLHWTATFLGI